MLSLVVTPSVQRCTLNKGDMANIFAAVLEVIFKFGDIIAGFMLTLFIRDDPNRFFLLQNYSLPCPFLSVCHLLNEPLLHAIDSLKIPKAIMT